MNKFNKIKIITIIVAALAITTLMLIDYTENEADKNTLQSILDHCAKWQAELSVEEPYLSYRNATHFINNSTCEWGIVFYWDDEFTTSRYD